jgi:SAM-dependent methyltransferase
MTNFSPFSVKAQTGRQKALLDCLTNLNLGCGTDIREDCINLDRSPLTGVDIVHDLAELPLPFPTARFGLIICQDVLEHVDIVPMMRELHRILSPGGILEVRVPHFTSPSSYSDPTHLRAFSIETFDFFCAAVDRDYYFDFAFSDLLERSIKFTKGRSYVLNYAIERLVNISPRMQLYYERSLLRVFPAINIHVRMMK